VLPSYLFDFPFLGDDSTITVDDNHVNPLYKHVFPPEVAPQLSFIGLPLKVSFSAKCHSPPVYTCMHAHRHMRSCTHAHILWCSLRSETLICSNQAIPFPLVELQSKWVAGVLSGWIKLPSKEEMMEDVKAFYSKLEARGWPKRYTHNLSHCQVDVYEYLVKLCDMITILSSIDIS
jgi:hypothetical protein